MQILINACWKCFISFICLSNFKTWEVPLTEHFLFSQKLLSNQEIIAHYTVLYLYSKVLPYVFCESYFY